MFELDDSNAIFLRRAISHGEGVLVLGAGASFSSHKKDGTSVKLGSTLASHLAKEAGLSYSNETLPLVISAAKPILGDERLKRIFTNEYSDIEPASDLRGLSNFTWKRLYTWNIDDAINNSLGHRTQRHRYYNGMIDSSVENDNISNLQIIKLHGDVLHPEHGFIMSEVDYARILAQGGHPWYRQLAKDYLSYTPIFIGSRLSEPVLTSEIERAMQSPTDTAGRGYVITPDVLSPIEKLALAARGLIHISATLEGFVNWLTKEYPSGVSPKQVLIATHNFSQDDLDTKIGTADLEAASAIFPRDMDRIHARAYGAHPAEIALEARRFLRGFPPTWDVAASNIPVWLKPTDDLFSTLVDAIKERHRMFVVIGQAGSGKTTALMQSLVRYGRTNKNTPVYELTGDVKSVKAALGVIQRLHSGTSIVYIADLFVFGDQLAEDLDTIDRGRIIIVGTARRSEWKEHLERRYGNMAVQHDYSRFTRSDYQPLIDRLMEYVPSPTFKALTPAERVSRLSRSQEQLLIALREATFSENFTDTITNEYEKLPDDDTRALLMIVGLATAARVGIEVGSAKEAYGRLARTRSFDDAESALAGIVARLPNGRLLARHELYIRHIIENIVSLDLLIDALISVCHNYTKYPIPVVRNVNRIEAALFRFCWNHKFIYEQCKRRNRLHDGERLYSSFEIEFQLDGHFWLQYGLYLSECGRKNDALVMLRRSIDAYPNNPFAVHAYAELQFQVAIKRQSFDSVVVELVGDAVRQLEELDSRSSVETDQYPLVTLATMHVGTLIHFDRHDDAVNFARIYHGRLQQMEKRIFSERVTSARERLFKFVTLGEWEVRRTDLPARVQPRRQRPR